MAGRKSKYTPVMVGKITDALRMGATRKAAYGAAGVSHEAFANWMNEKSEFVEAVTRAEHEAELKYTARIKDEVEAEKGDWRAAESWLKRRRREDWAEKIETEVSGKMTHEHINAGEDAILAAAEEIRFRRLIGDVESGITSGVHEGDVPSV